MMNWIIAYDIADRRRLQRVHRYLVNVAVPLQNSVFLFSGSHEMFQQHFHAITAQLNAREDDVRVYLLRGKVYSLGQPSLPQGLFLADFPEKSLVWARETVKAA